MQNDDEFQGGKHVAGPSCPQVPFTKVCVQKEGGELSARCRPASLGLPGRSLPVPFGKWHWERLFSLCRMWLWAEAPKAV